MDDDPGDCCECFQCAMIAAIIALHDFTESAKALGDEWAKQWYYGHG